MRPAVERPGTGVQETSGTAYPLVLDGASLDALIIGGGEVAARKARALLAAGARVRIVAGKLGPACAALKSHARATVEQRVIAEDAVEAEIADALLIVAATDSSRFNAHLADEARRLHRLVNVVDAPDAGNCVMPATHRAGGLTIAVTTGGVPGAARRIRDALAARFDVRYASALDALAGLRDRLLRNHDRAAWRAAADTLLAEDFCDSVERGGFDERVAAWR